jgi:hypothetical protein
VTPEQETILDALYRVEAERLERNDVEAWSTAAQVAQKLSPTDTHFGDEVWVRSRLTDLWIQRRILQVPVESAEEPELRDAVLDGLDVHGRNESRIALEQDDVRGAPASPWQSVALYGSKTPLHYRSRMAEIARLLSRNYQRFGMTPTTGLLRYVRRPQERPRYSLKIADLADLWTAQIRSGRLSLALPGAGPAEYPLSSDVDRERLCKALRAVLEALANQFVAKGRLANLAPFQALSIGATLCGLYSQEYRKSNEAHIVTAGVGSGKTFAFQVGAITHVAYKALAGERRVQVLFLYPRVVLAGNQFQDLKDLVRDVSQLLGVPLKEPGIDAGGQLKEQMEMGEKETGGLFTAIKRLYQTDWQIVISNLDTLANRLVHPEAYAGLTRDLDLIVVDEVHILSGLYGAHAKMLLRRLELVRAMGRLRRAQPTAPSEKLVEQLKSVSGPYVIGASATISEPRRHLARLMSRSPSSVLHLEVGETDPTGWVHHIFLRQRPESSSTTAVTNATSCLIHNRRDGIFREHYQRTADENGERAPLALDQLTNPVQPAKDVELRDTDHVHKTLGFCDSLDGVGRWASLVTDNERSSERNMLATPNPTLGEFPYFVRFQEPLWRAVHHRSFGQKPPEWQKKLWSHYGALCRDCKQGVKRRIPRMPPGTLTPAQKKAVDALWGKKDPGAKETVESYLSSLGVPEDLEGSDWFKAVGESGRQDDIANLDECSFFRSGLCWWWSMDHLGSNHPQPVSGATPIHGLKRPQASHPKYLVLNSIRLRSFSSRTDYNVFEADSINAIFRDRANRILHDVNFDKAAEENCTLVIGTPRIEVGIDLSRARDGITFRAMRDPASVQQKTGRVGREPQTDSLIVHLVTENARDHFYFRNPRIALDPDYLQPIPLHEDNQVVARNHYFMAIIDFLCLQGEGPDAYKIAADGDRIDLVNDHKYTPAFQNWDKKVQAVHDFLFGAHPRQKENLGALRGWLAALGASPGDISNPAAAAGLTKADAPLSRSKELGAIDVFEHEFGPRFFLSTVSILGKEWSLAALCAAKGAPPPLAPQAAAPRQYAFLQTMHSYHTPYGEMPKAPRDRGYLFRLLTLPVFRRGVPSLNLPGDQPFLWAPNFFDAAGNEFVRVFEEPFQGPSGGPVAAKPREKGFEKVGMALALLPPGTFTYRYSDGVRKVPVKKFGAMGLSLLGPKVFAVGLKVDDPEWYQLAGCPPIALEDLPPDYSVVAVDALEVYSPRQIGLVWAPDAPGATGNGLVADGDDAGIDERPQYGMPTPPVSFPLRWFRVVPGVLATVPCRFQKRFQTPGGTPAPALPLPEVFRLFRSVSYGDLDVTEFVWGLDRGFKTRRVDPARLVYTEGAALKPLALGQSYRSPGLAFEVDLKPGSTWNECLDTAVTQVDSGAHQTLLVQVLYEFLARNALNQPDPAQPWLPGSRPSSFTVKNLATLVLFHLLERWHPPAATGSGPSGPPLLRVEDLAGCFTQGHANFIDPTRFDQLAQWVASVENPASVPDRADTLRETQDNFRAACSAAANLDAGFVKSSAKDVALNALGITIHAAAMRLTGADSSDIAYFYKIGVDGSAWIYLFDTDQYGNGTAEVLRNQFHVSSAERVLAARLQALGVRVDALPTTDFATCLEDGLQECANGHASQLAFHDHPANGPGFEDLEAPVGGERQIAGPVFDFLRTTLGIASVDHTSPFQHCPQFLAHIGDYPRYATRRLVPSPTYPTFQALESAMGFCLAGCISCVVAPELNIRGVLGAKASVNKLLLDALYRAVVCESGTPRANVLYPGPGPGRTEEWQKVATRVASGSGVPDGTAAFDLELKPGMTATVVPAAMPAGWERVVRPTWAPAVAPPTSPRVRPRMTI